MKLPKVPLQALKFVFSDSRFKIDWLCEKGATKLTQTGDVWIPNWTPRRPFIPILAEFLFSAERLFSPTKAITARNDKVV